ncbi:hypothetical protein [Asticcacaulis excentricus]|uniref:Uncharacterized protein n=1 Tax=Asticcacaulis excentricus (strain ATCC 15261 / DSM 4724 / KCTC 12464 / NCIMB 9791 / VKM B-1370 / CB 48) TaxID=573065 RepID=E8RPM5_ASTEC|nr:hypothetical protein [Asticcacaulis excentricus]ADU12002.1 hypothetical protein Astex_0304 [Asticcacaulis excentricus CB 48]
MIDRPFPIRPIPCLTCRDDARIAAFKYDNNVWHVECLRCEVLGPGEWSLRQAVKSWNNRANNGLQLDAGVIVRPFKVSVSGFPEATYMVTSRQKAIATAWRDIQTCGYRYSFKDFLKLATATQDAPPAHFGTAITVSGKPAFFVGCNRQYVQFVRPGDGIIRNSHPYDVLPETMRPASYGGPL